MARQKIPWDADTQATLAALLRDNTPGISGSNVAGNEGQSQIASGVVGDLFNLLSRPSRAIAGAAYSAVDKNPDTSVVGGITQGLTGHGEHNFADVLSKMGLKNRVARSALGFGLDVGLDPLTYLGVKGEKGLNATEALSQAVQHATASNVPRELFGDAVDRTVAKLQADNPSHLYVEFAGKKISPNIVTPNKAANVVKDAIVGPAGDRRNLAKMFSRESELPFGLAQRARIYESGTAAAFQDHRNALMDLFGEMHPDDRKATTFALESGSNLNTQPLLNGVKREGFNTVGDYVKVARKQLDAWFEDEVRLGLRDPAAKVDNYVYKQYLGDLPETHPGLSKAAISRVQGNFGQDLKNISLQDAERAGFKPITDVAEMLQERGASHYRNIGRAQLVLDALNPESPSAFSVKANPDNIGTLKNLGWLDVGEHVAAPAAKQFKGEGVYAPPQIVKVMNQTERVLTDNQVGGDFLKWYDKITHQWKFLNTMVNPGYWTRNSMSDGIMNFMDGVRNPKHYQQAFRVLMEHRGNNTAEMLSNLTGEVAQDIRRTKIDFHGQRVDASQVWNDFLRAGGKTGDITTNITAALDPQARQGIGNYLSKTTQAAGEAAKVGQQTAAKVATKMTDWNNMREDWFRLAHFLSATEDQLQRNIPYETAIMKAGERIRKYNIDYGALSSFEKKYVRRGIPFYSWMRRNTPLQVELLLTRPGFMAGYAKGNDLMQGLLGTEDGSGDYLVPKWIRDSAPVRVALGNNKSKNPIDKIIRMAAGASGAQSVFAPVVSSMTPAGDLQHITQPIQAAMEAGGLRHPGAALAATASTGAGDILNMVTPGVKGLVELGTKRNLFTGQKIDNWQEWMSSQIAPGRAAGNVATGNVHGLTSMLSGLQLQPVTAARQKGEFRRRQDVLTARSKASGTPASRAELWKRYLSMTGRSVGA